MPICEMALFKAAYAFVLKLAPVSRGSTANFNVFITVSTRPGSFRLVAWRPVFGPAFAFRPLNEEYCIPDTVYTTSAFVHSRRNFFFPPDGMTQHSCCGAANAGGGSKRLPTIRHAPAVMPRLDLGISWQQLRGCYE